MRVMSVFPSLYLSAEDLSERPHDVTIVDVRTEEVGSEKETRPILFVEEFAKGVCLNKTNSKRIVALYGPETDAWKGRRITIYPSECEFAGETVPCIRVKQAAPADRPKTSTKKK